MWAKRSWLLSLVLLAGLPSHVKPINNRWCPKLCECYNDYSTVDCSNKGIPEIPVLSNLTQHLFLDANDISNLPNDAFLAVPNLIKLHVRNSKLTSITTRSFCGLQKLQELHLGHNEIAEFQIEQRPDCKLPNLKNLVLSGNKLREAPRNLSMVAPNLEILILHNNNMESLYLDESYNQMRSLENLDVSLNRIHEITRTDLDALRYVVPLEILRMSDCGLVFVHPKAFVGMNNLTSLSISRSLVASLKTIFKPFIFGENHMTHLDLSVMLLPSLTSDMLGMFHKLVYLDGSYSGVEYIQPALFNQIQNLESLLLRSNHLIKLENVVALPRLRRLDVNTNELTEINLRNLTSLEMVDLSHNQLTTLPTNWMCFSERILMLNLSYNQIDGIDRHAFSQVNINILDLSHNQLTSLGPIGTVEVHILDISHNSLSSVSSESFYFMSNKLGDLDLSYNQLTKLPLDIFEDFHSLRRLSLRHNAFGSNLQSGQQEALFMSLGHLQELDLSYNFIRSLPSKQFRALHHLSTLNLQGNYIHDLAMVSLADLPSLAKLVVSNNQLSSVQTDVISQLDFLEVLDASTNPYECTCNLQPFLDWLSRTRVIVLEHKNQTKYCCSFPPALAGRYIVSVSPGSETCKSSGEVEEHHKEHTSGLLHHQRLAIVAIVLACVLLMVIVGGLLAYFGRICQHIKSLHYRWQVRYREVSGVEIAGDPKA